MADKQPSKMPGNVQPLGANIPNELLFKRAPKQEECPICFLTLPNECEEAAMSYSPCCGVTICVGCRHRTFFDNNICPFCRSNGDEEDFIKDLEKRVARGDSKAMFNLGVEYQKGRCIKVDREKAVELFHQAAEHGSICAHAILANIYYKGGDGLEINTEKAAYHELTAAMGGHNIARHNIACRDFSSGHIVRAMNHYMIAASDGYQPSLDAIKQAYVMGIVKKEAYAMALRAYQESQDARKSKERDDALKFMKDALANPESFLT